MTPTTTLFEQPTKADALISPCGRYRYWLTRTWDDGRPPVVFVMLNPSTADANADDPTIRRCVGFAKAWGHGGIVVVNLFAYRATDPGELKRVTWCVQGPDNDAHILTQTAPRDGRIVVAAWGCDGALYGRDRDVMALLEGRDVRCLGTTKDGHPKHPLYLRADLSPIPFTLRSTR